MIAKSHFIVNLSILNYHFNIETQNTIKTMSAKLNYFILGSACALLYNYAINNQFNIKKFENEKQVKSTQDNLETVPLQISQPIINFNEKQLNQQNKVSNDEIYNILLELNEKLSQSKQVEVIPHDEAFELFEEFLRPNIVNLENNIIYHKDIIQDGLPSYENLTFYKSYVCSHDLEKKIPKWTIHELDRAKMSGQSADRRFSIFNSRIPGNFPNHTKALNEDYLRSGYSRGHLVPAGDIKFQGQDALDETFYLNSNIVPQEYTNNANYWYQMEYLAKSKLVKNFKKVRILSGPLFIPKIKDDNGKNKKYQEYQLLGKNNVAVPTHLYKIYLCESNDNDHFESTTDNQEILTKDRRKHKKYNNGSKKYIAAFVVPNEPIHIETPLTDFQVPIEYIEKNTGLSIYPILKEREGFNDLCKYNLDYCSLLKGNDWKIHDLVRRLYWNYEDDSKLTVVYNELKELGGVTPQIEEYYQKSLVDFQLNKKYEKSISEPKNYVEKEF